MIKRFMLLLLALVAVFLAPYVLLWWAEAGQEAE